MQTFQIKIPAAPVVTGHGHGFGDTVWPLCLRASAPPPPLFFFGPQKRKKGGWGGECTGVGPIPHWGGRFPATGPTAPLPIPGQVVARPALASFPAVSPQFPHSFCARESMQPSLAWSCFPNSSTLREAAFSLLSVNNQLVVGPYIGHYVDPL